MADRTEVAQVSRGGWQIPDWLSPPRLLALSDPQWELVTVPAATLTPILKPSARRVGLIVIANPSDAAPPQVTPYPRATTFGFNLTGGNNPLIVTLADWLSLCCGPWYCISAGGCTLQVCDISRPV